VLSFSVAAAAAAAAGRVSPADAQFIVFTLSVGVWIFRLSPPPLLRHVRFIIL